MDMENDGARERYGVQTRRRPQRQRPREAGPRKETVARPRIGSLDPDLTECPICTRQLDQPKSLSCLHSFCKECLSNYIEGLDKTSSESSFPCPVCNSKASPDDPSTAKETWAEQFPTNNMILAIERIRSFEKGIHQCEPCRRKHNMYSIAEHWCKSCDYHMCDKCRVDFHQYFHENHETQPLADVQKSLSSLASSFRLACEQHMLQMDMVCIDHSCLCCAKCVAVTHRKCDKVYQVSDYVKELKSGTNWKDLISSLETGTKALTALVDDFKNQLKSLVGSKDKAVKVIAQLRRNIDKQLDALQTDIRAQLNDTFKDEQRKMDAMIRKCETLKNSMRHSLKMSKSGMILDDDSQMVSVYQRGKLEFESCKSAVDKAANAFGTVNFDVALEPDLEKLKSFPSFGNVSVSKTPLDLPKNVDIWPPLISRFPKEIKKFKVRNMTDKTNCHITGAVDMGDGTILLSDYNNKKLKLMTLAGELLDQLNVKDNPYDLCKIGEGKVALTRPVCKTVSLYDVNSSKVFYIADADTVLEKYCQGITCAGEGYLISSGGSSPCQVYSISKEGEDFEVIRNNKSPCNYLAYDESRGDVIISLYVKSKSDVAVFRQNLYSQNCVEVVRGDVAMGARGVDIDREGNIYVCGEASSTVIQISQNGKEVRTILTSKDGIKNPLVICACGSKILLTEKNMDYVKVFQMVREK